VSSAKSYDTAFALCGAQPLTVSGALFVVDAIRLLARDDERAHQLEDALHRAALETIAGQPGNGWELAQAVLLTRGIEFSRWCA